MARSSSSVIGGALRTVVRFAHVFLYSFSMPRACFALGFWSSGIQVRSVAVVEPDPQGLVPRVLPSSRAHAVRAVPRGPLVRCCSVRIQRAVHIEQKQRTPIPLVPHDPSQRSSHVFIQRTLGYPSFTKGGPGSLI